MPASTLDIELLVRETFIARVEHHATLGSTNDRAKECAVEGADSLPLLIVADQQTSGRGRGTNRWWSGPGSLACSLLLEVNQLGADRRRWVLAGLAAAAACVQTVAPLLRSHKVGIHWPNDVFVEGRKLGGVLVEVVREGRLVIGIGLNLNNSLGELPPGLQKTAATLLELCGRRSDKTQILASILRHLAEGLGQLACWPEQVGARADALCLQHGRMLTIQRGGRSICGRCVGIGSDGGLVLDTAEGRRTYYSGVVR